MRLGGLWRSFAGSPVASRWVVRRGALRVFAPLFLRREGFCAHVARPVGNLICATLHPLSDIGALSGLLVAASPPAAHRECAGTPDDGKGDDRFEHIQSNERDNPFHESAEYGRSRCQHDAGHPARVD